jgi:hypothetical protein
MAGIKEEVHEIVVHRVLWTNALAAIDGFGDSGVH